MLNRSIITLAFGLLIAATTAQDVVLVAKGVKPPSRPAKPARQGAQHPDEAFRRVMSKVPDSATREAEENHLGSFSRSGAPFKRRVGEMSIYLEKVEATFDQIYYEQYLEELKSEAASAISAGSMTEPGEFSPTIARPPKKVLKLDRTVTSTSPYAITTTTYSAGNPGAACDAWVSLIRYCGTTETDEKSLSECYCTSATYNVPDQWNLLAARCATARYNCKDSTDYRCDLTDQASSYTDFCDTDGTTVRFYTDAKSKIARQTDDSWMGSSASASDEDDSSDQESGDDDESGGSSGDYAAKPAAAQPKSTSSASQAYLTTESASPGSTRTAHSSRTSSSSLSATLPSATSTSSAQSLVGTLDVLVSRFLGLWLLAICVLCLP